MYGLYSTIFDALFNTYWAAAIPVLALITMYYLTFQFSKEYLDAGLSQNTMLLKLRI
jgi:hypothetical protein